MFLVTLPTFVFTCLLSIRSASWAYAFVLTFYCMEMTLLASMNVFLANPALANYLFATTIALSAFGHVLQLSPAVTLTHCNRVVAMITALLGWSILTLVWSPGAERGREFVVEGIPYMVVFVVLAPLLIDSVEGLRRAMIIFLGLGSLVSFLLLISPEFRIRGGRLSFAVGTTDVVSVLSIGRLGGSLVIVSALLRLEGTWLLVLRVVAFSFGGLLAIYSGSRGQILFAGVTLLIFFPLARPLRNVRGFFVAALGLMFAYLVASTVLDVFTQQADIDRWDPRYVLGALNARLANISELLQEFYTRPQALAVGLGYNAFSAVTSAAEDAYSHNIFIDAICELGVPAFLVLCFLLFTVARQARELFYHVSQHLDERVVVITLLGLSGFDLLIAQKEGQLWNHFVMYMHFCIIARLRLTRTADLAASETYDAESGDTLIVKSG